MSKKAEVLDPHHPLPPEFEVPENRPDVIPTAIERREAPVAVTPMRLLEIATSQNADVDKLAKLMELQLRWEANEARKAYVAAMKDFKAESPEILKNRTASVNPTFSYDYATLDNICEKIAPAMSKHGLTYRWRMQQADAKIRVTCVITHEMGHSEEEATLEASSDTSGGKNAIQAVGSTVSYLERYTLLAACGLAVKGHDTDGNMPGADLEKSIKSISSAPDTSALKDVFMKAAQKALDAKDGRAVIAMTNARDARKKQLEGAA